MTLVSHKDTTTIDNHINHSWEFTNAAARTGSVYSSVDIGKDAMDLDTKKFFRVKSVSLGVATFIELGSSGEPVISAGTAAQYWRGDKSWQTLATDVLSSVLTGFSSGAGTVAATDTILQAFNKIVGNISAKQNTISSTMAFINSLTGKTTPVNADTVVISDSADSNYSKSVSLTDLWSNYFKGKADVLYGTIARSLPSGGTTGQVLSKSSNSDYAVAWSTVSGGGGSLIGVTNGSFPNNTFYGYLSGASTPTGNSNTASGVYSLFSLSSGSKNSAFGWEAMYNSTTQDSNTAIGYRTLRSNTSGGDNTAVGAEALFNSTSNSNTAVGKYSLNSNTSGYSNTAIGNNSLVNNTINSNCTGLGYNTAVTGSNQVQLGDSATTTYAYGAVQNRSDSRDKTDIRDITLGLEFINRLRPVDAKWDMREDYRPPMPNKESFETEELYKVARLGWIEACKLENITHDGTHKRNRYHHFLIAQEVKAVMDDMGVDFAGYQDHKLNGGDDVLSIGYVELVPVLIKAVQELNAKSIAQDAVIADLTARLVALEG